ncbi:MAG: hypothetical protein AUI10_11685 [Actinobacteria bacterium 13_2_20CM_2_72_6]|jgi:hypothetical protein|nr:MAG: hypothetical protein AUI10_11685 [Actinobacteria bacterium 13_2_20CM_2_72_6]
MKFAMLLSGNEAEFNQAPREELDARLKEIFAWFEKWGPAGKIADPGIHLQPTSTAKTVRPGPDGGTVVTDGPYLELKEVIGGFVVLEAEDIEDALSVARTWPGLRGSASVEVRPLFDHS